ncbi:MAG: universal stress protein [Thiohalocapsa sp.]
MPVKAILLPLSEADAPGPVLETALGLAQRFQAHLDVLYVMRNPRSLLPYATLGLSKHMRDAVLEAAEQNAGAQAAQARELLDKLCAQAGVPIVKARGETSGATARWREATGQEDVDPSPDELVEYLGWHGVEAEVKIVDSHDPNVGASLLKVAGELGINLLVVGGYSRSRLRELILGGVTAHLLRSAEIPVFMLH